MLPFFAAPIAVGSNPGVSAHVADADSLPQVSINGTAVPNVPFYSQFTDVSSSSWKGKACGITSLAMLIGYYKDDAISVDALLKEGISDGAYDKKAGWTYSGLVQVAKAHGLNGNVYDLSSSTKTDAYAQLQLSLQSGPVIASVHYKFDPKSTIPHLVVIDSIKDGVVYYNDPAATEGEKTISVDTFLSAWKKRFITIRPQGTVHIT